MTFAVVFVVTAILSVVFADVIKKVPWLFYALAVAAVVVLFLGLEGMLSGGWWKPLILLVRRCMVALALFAVVMLVGVLPKESRLALRLRSVRAELSIIACLLCVGHVLAYFATYVSRLLAGSLLPASTVSISAALVLAILLVVLGVTSFSFVKKLMHAAAWKRVQRFSYLFFALIYVHLMFMLVPFAVSGSSDTLTNVCVYTILFGAYTIARVVRWKKDSKGNDGEGQIAALDV